MPMLDRFAESESMLASAQFARVILASPPRLGSISFPRAIANTAASYRNTAISATTIPPIWPHARCNGGNMTNQNTG